MFTQHPSHLYKHIYTADIAHVISMVEFTITADIAHVINMVESTINLHE